MLRRLRAAGLIFISLCIAFPFIPTVHVTAAIQTFPYAIKQIAAGSYHTLLVSGDDTVWAWGANDGGAVGNGTTEGEVYRPVQVLQSDGSILSDVKSVTGGLWHSAALKKDGTVWGWGYNAYGQVGDGTTESRGAAAQVITTSNSPLTDVVKVKGAGNNTFAIRSDGTLWGWGSNIGNMPGPSNVNPKASQMKASSSTYLTQVKDVAGGRYHVLLLKEDGTVWAWGTGTFGALGNGSTSDANYPVQVKMQDGGYLTDIVQVASNEISSFALRSDGTVWSWGNNLYGNLGNGGSDSTSAVQVQESSGVPLTGVVSIDGGIQISVALKSDGTVWWWGLQNSGYPKATRVNLSGMVEIASGANYGVARKNDGTLWSWAWNTDGQFALDPYDLTYSLTPVQSYPPIGAVSVSPASIPADGVSTATITVTLKNGANKPLTAGEGSVELQSTLGSLSQVTDNGNGTYSAVLTAGTTSGTAAISGKINGYPFAAQGSVVLKPLTPSMQNSTITASPVSLTADGSSKSTITVQLKDANGNNLTASAGTVTLNTTAGTLGTVSDKGNGTYTAVLTSPTLAGSAVIRGQWNGTALSQTANVAFVPGPASVANSTLAAGLTSIPADGTSKTTLTVQLKDGYGNPLTTSGGTVTLSTTAGGLSAVTDVGNGTYTAELTAPTVSGSAVISGKLSGTSILQTAAVLFVPGAASASKSSLTAGSNQLTADGSSHTTVTVQLKDANGNNLTTSGGTVTLSTTAGTLSSVTDQGNGTYTAQLTAPTLVGQATISGKLGGTSLGQTAAVTFVPGAPSAAKATMAASPTSLTADGSSKSTITVQLKDANGNNLTTSGGTVTLTTTAGMLGAVTDHQNGSYTAQLTAPKLTGTARISGKLSGSDLGQSASVSLVAGPASAAESLLTAGASSLTADGSSTTTITVQLKDANGNNLASSGGTVTLNTTAGTLGAVTDHNNGSYTAQLTSPVSAGTAIISGRLSGTALAQTAVVSFVPGAASTQTSLLQAGKASLTADGTSTTTISVQLKDANGNNLTDGGDAVTLNTTAGSLGQVTDHGNGSYTAELTAPTASGTAVISGKLSGTDFMQTAAVDFLPGSASMEQTTIRVDPDGLTADGVSEALVTVQLKDTYGNKLTASAGTVALRTSAGTMGAVTDHGDGSYTAQLTAPTESGRALITGSLSGVPIVQNAEMAFNPGSPSVETSVLTLSPDQLTADGQSTSDIMVQLKDAHGNNLTVSGGELTLHADSGVISQVMDRGNGSYTAVLTAPKTAGTATVTAALNGVSLKHTATLVYLAGKASAAASEITVNQQAVTADGVSGVLIHVQLKDENGNHAPGGDQHQIQINSTLGTVSEVVYLADGSYEAELTSAKAGKAWITATMDGVRLDDQEQVEFRPGAFSPQQTVLTSSESSLPANGLGVSLLTLEIKDAFGNLTDEHPDIRSETSLGSLSAFTRQSQGRYTAFIYSYESGTAEIRVFAGDEELSPPLQISFGDGMFITPSNYSIEVGGKAPTVVQAVYGLNRLDWTDGVSWSFDPERVQIAKEDTQWFIYGLKPGNTVISAVYGQGQEEIKASASVTIYAVLNGLNLDAAAYELQPGGQVQMHVMAAYNDGTFEEVTGQAEYHLQDSSIGQVNAEGRLTGLTPGHTTITAVYQGQTAHANLTVIQTEQGGGPGSGNGSEPGGGSEGSSPPPPPPASSPSSTIPPSTAVTGASNLTLQIQYDQKAETLNLTPEEVKNGRVQIKTMQGKSGWALQLPEATINQILALNPALKIEWQTPAGRVLLPVREFAALRGRQLVLDQKPGQNQKPAQEQAQPQAQIQVHNQGTGAHGSGESTLAGLRFEIKQPASDLQTLMENTAAAAKAEVLTQPFSFTAAALYSDGLSLPLGISGELTLLLEGDIKVNPEEAAAAVFDEKSHQFRFVPARFSRDDSGAVAVNLLVGGINQAFVTLWERNASFEDMQQHWAHQEAELLARKGILQGKTAGRFALDDWVTRAELASILARGLFLPEGQKTSSSPFADVGPAVWYSDAVRAVSAAGIVQGDSRGNFNPQAGVTRQEMAVMISRAMKYAGAGSGQPDAAAALNGFRDQDRAASWAEEALGRALQAGILQGDANHLLHPEQTCTRAEMAVIVTRMLRQMGYLN